MNYFLDTNICIYFLTGKYSILVQKLRQMRPDEIKIPSMVKAELLYGAEKSRKREENLIKAGQFLLPYEIVPFDDAASAAYSTIRSSLERAGMGIGPNDLLIASTVLSRGGILVTNNGDEYGRVRGMKIENWIR